MLDFPRWKVWSISLVILIGILFAIPSMLPSDLKARYPKFLPSATINLGLDLAGGSQLLLEADQADAAKQRLQGMEDQVTTELRRTPRVEIGDISTAGGRVSFLVRDPTQVDTAVERLASAVLTHATAEPSPVPRTPSHSPRRAAEHCCVDRSDGCGSVCETRDPRSEAVCELRERAPDSIVDGQGGGEFVMAAAQVLYECVPGRDDAQRGDRFQPAHRAKPRFEPTVVGFHRVVRIPLKDVAERQTADRR